jgi:heme exporter protein B
MPNLSALIYKKNMNILYFELLKLRKKSRGWLGPILVFILIMTAFPLTVEFLNKDLEQAFFSILWIAVLLVMMLATEDIFLEDYNDGSLEQLVIHTKSLSFIIGAKILIYWSLIGVPVSVIGSIYCLGITSSHETALLIFPVLLISSYIFLNLFCFGNSLTLTKGSVLGTLITMPLLAKNLGLNYFDFQILLLGVLSIIIVIIPLIISFVIRAHLE